MNRRKFLEFALPTGLVTLFNPFAKLVTAFEEPPKRNAVETDQLLEWDTQQIKPHFKGHTLEGTLVEIEGSPQKITTNNKGKVTLEFFNEQTSTTIQVDPLCILSEKYGEHPAEKVLRLKNTYQLAISPDLETKLQNPLERDAFFHHVITEYQPNKQHEGVILELETNGSFLTTINLQQAPEWQYQPPTTDTSAWALAVFPEHLVDTSLTKNRSELQQFRTESLNGINLGEPTTDQNTISKRAQDFMKIYIRQHNSHRCIKNYLMI